MDWYSTVLEQIDMRSFSNLWYWIALAVLWSTVSHWVLGVPYDMVQRAARIGGHAQIELEDLVRINISRILYIVEYAGLWILAIACGVFTTLFILGFFYDLEFAQAVFLLIFPTTVVAVMSVLNARAIKADGLDGEALRRKMGSHRFWTQVIGVISIFITSVFGMYQNLLVVGPF